MTATHLERLFSLSGSVALVTGARHGIGRALATGLARAGATVAVTARERSVVAGLADELSAYGQALAVELDVTDPESTDRAIETVVHELGRLDTLVNNAGFSYHAPASDFPADKWDAVIATNLTGALRASQAAARVMRTDGGAIINLSSPFGRCGTSGRVAYSVSKAGLDQLTRSLAIEWAPLGIRVNALAPTTVPTETRAARLSDAVREERIAQIPLGRLGRADDLVGAAVLLAGHAGNFITGQTILVDGGYSTMRL